MSIHGHRSLDWFSIGHVKLLEHFMCIFSLTYESPFVHLLDLKTNEEFQFTHHGHLESLGHDSTKLFTKLFISRTKDNVININLTYKEIFIYFLSKESRIGFAHYKAILEKQFPKAFIPCSRSLLKPIEHLMELEHIVGMLGFFKARGLLYIN